MWLLYLVATNNRDFMINKLVISVLIVLLSIPPSAGTTAWMAMSMSDSGPASASLMPMDAMHQHHMPSAASGQASAEDPGQAHDHREADCEEHCMSCSSHCSSTAIVSSSRYYFDPVQHLAGTLTGATSNRHELLFRPPILVQGSAG